MRKLNQARQPIYQRQATGQGKATRNPARGQERQAGIEPWTLQLRQIEARRSEVERTETEFRLAMDATLGAFVGDESGWYIRGSDERVRTHRQRLEALAVLLDGYRAKLMVTSHRIQYDHDRRKRGL
jgi:hypothetical protein